MQIKDYKPHIDGLRALAVLPVIFFHSNFPFFEGGFVGVDIFFVISGYLITKIILREIQEKRFTITNFYQRRARRILPALYFIILFTIPVSIFVMSKDQLLFYSEQILSVLFFISNFFFWENTGYFNPNSDLQPLLHTWSLAVEEQFYIFFPIIFLVLIKFFKNKIIFFIILISIVSMIISQFGGNFKIVNLSLKYPFLNLPFDFFWQAGSGNFYLPFGRIWELMLGTLIAILFDKINTKKVNTNNYLSLIGFVMIIISIIFYSESMLYPSFLTLLPCLGTGLIIVYTDKNTVMFRILTLKPIIFLGLISYSLYLWHQPLLALNRIYYGVHLSFYHTMTLLIVALILSIFTWKYIEKPFRNRKIVNNKNFIKIIFSLFGIIAVISVLIYNEKINSGKYEIPKKLEQSMLMAKHNGCLDIEGAHLNNKNDWYCVIGNKNKKISFAILGDSHASAIRPGFDLAAGELNKKGIMTGFSGCPGLLGIQSIRDDTHKRNCKQLAQKFYEFVKEKKIKKVFLISRWTYYTDGEYNGRQFAHITSKDNIFQSKKNSRNSFNIGLKNTIENYKNINVELYFFHQVPMQLFSAKFAYQNSFDKINNSVDQDKLNNISVDFEKNMKLQSFVRKKVNIYKNKESSFNTIDLNEFFCEDKKCLIGNKNFSFYADDDHLSIEGAKAVKNELKKYLN